MTRPPLEVADIVRAQGDRFIQHNFRWIHWTHRKVLLAIARCRTAALGGHRDQCPRCGYRAISYNSCRNRHCPKCQSGARDKWIVARQSELLPVAYVHVVFTLPHQLAPLALQNKKVLYGLLFRASAETLLEVAGDPAISAPTSASLPSCIPGVKIFWLIRTSTVSFQPEVSRPTAPAGSIPAIPSSCPSTYSVASFAASSSPLSNDDSSNANSPSPDPFKPLENEKAFRSFLRPCSVRTGSSMPNRPSAVPIMSSAISPATPIASPSPTIAWSPSSRTKSLSAGKIMPTEIRRE